MLTIRPPARRGYLTMERRMANPERRKTRREGYRSAEYPGYRP